MSTALLGAGVFGVVVFVGFTTPAVSEPEAPPTTVQGSPSAPAGNRPVMRPDELSDAAIAAVAGATATTPDLILGAAVLDRKTNGVSVNPAATVPIFAASLAKVLVAVDVLSRRHSGLAVSDRDVMLIGQALGPSDDEAMNMLWTRFDGFGAVERVAQQLGLAQTQPPANPSRWGETLTSAHDTVVLYRHVLDTMAPEDRDLIMGSIATAPPIASDGFDQTFGLLAAGTSSDTAAKQAWMCCQGGRIMLHSAGTVDQARRFIVVLLSTQPRDAGYDGATATLTAAADAARAALLNNQLTAASPRRPCCWASARN